MIYCSRGVVWHKSFSDTAEVFIHMHMRFDPRRFTLIDECFSICILAVRHYTDEDPCFGKLSGIRINDLCRITSPVNFDLFTGLAWNVHSSTALFFILLYVMTELRIHKRLIASLTTLFKIFCPQQFLGYAVALQLFADILEVWHAPFGLYSFMRKQLLAQSDVRHGFIQRPCQLQLSGTLLNFRNGFL